MKRRTMLKALAGGCLLGSSALAGRIRPRFAAGKGGSLKKLVVVFQRGGNDGLNTLVPVANPQYGYYQNLRPDVYLPLDRLRAINGESFFMVPPSFDPLIPIIQADNMSLIHCVGYPSPDHSHFESQSYFETAVPGSGLLDGWLNRYLQNTSGPGIIRGISIGYNIPQSVSGTIPVPVSRNFGLSSVDVDYVLGDTPGDNYRQSLKDILALTPSAGNELVYTTGSRIFDMIEAFQSRDLNDYTPENGAVYPNTGIAQQVAHAAQMLKDDPDFLGVEVVTIDQGGYDTHANQINPANRVDQAFGHQRLLAELNGAMAAFYADMGPTRMNDIVFMVVTEFGRRAYQNDSSGTDHGTGSVVMVMGNPTNGSIINGGANWPGLHSNDLYYGDLDWVTDFRDIYAEILSGHMGLDSGTMSLILPGHSYTPVGFIT